MLALLSWLAIYIVGLIHSIRLKQGEEGTSNAQITGAKKASDIARDALSTQVV